jgi:hypothetical protein
MEPSCDAAPAPSTSTMNSRRFIRSPVRGPHATIVAGMVSAWAAASAQLRYRSSCFMATPVERYPQEFRSAQPFTCCQPSWTILASMGTRPDTPVRALRRRHDALLTIWLTFLDELDNPVHPLAAECQQEPRLRRDTSTRGLSQIRAVNYSLLVRSAKRPRPVGPRGSLKRGVATV